MDPLQHDDKLISTETRHRIGLTQRVSDPACALLQEPIAGGMPDAVVQHLEPIEINEQDGDLGAIAPGTPKGQRKALLEFQPIRQPCKSVVSSDEAQSLFGTCFLVILP